MNISDVKNKTLYRIACRIIVLPLIGLTLCGCGKKQGSAERPPALVTVSDACSQDVPAYIDEIGTCTAYKVVSVQSQVTGQITEINFVDGAYVKKGELLFVIDPRPYQAALAQAQAGLAQSLASLELDKSEFNRAKSLLPTGAISKEEYEVRQSALGVGEAQIQASKAAIETAKINLDYCYIHSPVDGLAGKRLIDIGNVITATNSNFTNTTPLLVIQQMDPIYADFTITERDLMTVRQKMAEGTLKTYVSIPDTPMADAREGDLTFLDNAVQQGTGTVRLRATLQNPDNYFWPGQFVNVRLVLNIIKEAVLVPSEAVQTSQNGPFVYVLKPDSTAELRIVKLGQQQDKMVVIAEGLKAGEKVITSGQMAISPGGKVRVQDANAAAEGKK